MSYSAAAIRTAITEALEGSIGTVRTMTAGVAVRGVWKGMAAQAQHAKGLLYTHRFDVKLGSLKNHEATPVSSVGSYRLAVVDVDIDVLTVTATQAQATDRDTTLAAIGDDLETGMQALAYPGNLALTAASVPTNIISGMLLGQGGDGSPEWAEVDQDWTKQQITSRISGSVIVRIQQPTIADSAVLTAYGTSLRGWWRGDQLQHDAALAVSSAFDISGFARHAADAFAPRPTYFASGQGERPFFRSVAATSSVLTGADALFLPSNPPNIYIVGAFTALDAGQERILFRSLDTNAGEVVRVAKSTGGFLQFTVGATVVTTTLVADTGVHMYSFLHDGATARVSVDGGTEYTGAATPPNAFGSTSWGFPSTSGSNAAGFDFYEIKAINAYPSAALIAFEKQYVRDRYGLTIT